MQLRAEVAVFFFAMNHDEHDELWDLLGKARAPKERPFFAAKVMRAIREEGEAAAGARETGGLVAWLRRWHLPFAMGVTVAVVVAIATAPRVPVKNSEVVDAGRQTVVTTDPLAGLAKVADDAAELGASLDNLMATQDNSIWLQADPSSLY